MTAFRLYSSSELPPDFQYPAELKRFAQTGEYPAIYPWWFVDGASEAGELFYSTRQFDGRNLIPFAKVDDGRNDIACFDGDDASGNPEVLMLILDDSGRGYGFRDFDDWLAAAMKDANGS
eukprot:TRINITY_DN94068_c0_g1_i1.p2 TRINITY_DN94068_c0_g1~~TRINITY_DN94068_c0_g1_i1.p2  ORF type:complete len:120 (+),score=10.51 TRINITY_DN94068_c0_g1_i1:186-545(+)